MTTRAFETVRALLAPYEAHFTRRHADDPAYYDLQDDRDHARTAFAEAYPWKGGVRFLFRPLTTFRELATDLPPLLAAALKQKYVLDLPAVTKPERAALAKLVEAGWRRVAAVRALAPELVYNEKIDRTRTRKLVDALVARRKDDDVTVTETKSALVVRFPTAWKVPAVLAGKPGTIKLATITPAQYDALKKLLQR